MKNYFITLIFSLFCIQNAFSDNFNIQTVYFVDMQQVLDKSPRGIKSKNELKTAVDQSHLKINALKTEVDQLRIEIEKQASLLSEQAFNSKQNSLVMKTRSLQKLAEDEQLKIEDLRSKTVESLVNETNETISKLSKIENFPLVVEKGSPIVCLLYTSPSPRD